MTINVNVNVFCSNVKKKKGNSYKADFVFQQTSPTDVIYIKEDGDIDLSGTDEAVYFTFNWLSTRVDIDGTLCGACYSQPLNLNIWIKEGKDSTPTSSNSPPTSGDYEFVVPNNATTYSALVLQDQNNDAKNYAYTLRVWTDLGRENGSGTIENDPKIYNKGAGN